MATDAGIDHHGIASVYARDLGPYCVNHSHAIGAQNPGRDYVSPWNTTHGPQINVVERSRAESHTNISRCGDCWLREIFAKPHLFESAMRVDRERPHHYLLLLFIAPAGVVAAMRVPAFPRNELS
jgi:hypothetical protein